MTATLTWDRPARIRALAWSLPDVTPAPKGQVFEQGRGVSPSRWEPCRACLDGVVRDRFGRESRCDVCSGAGRVRVDAYTLDVVASHDSTAPARTRRVLCDRCGGTGVSLIRYSERGRTAPVDAQGHSVGRCEMCNGSGEVTVPDLRPSQPLVRARFVDAGSEITRLRETGSYDELERALATVRALEPQALRVWLLVRVHGVRSEADAGGWLRAGDVLVAAEMPGRVLVPAAVREAWLRLQDGLTLEQRCRALARRGVGMKAIAQAQGVTEWQVRKALGAASRRPAA